MISSKKAEERFERFIAKAKSIHAEAYEYPNQKFNSAIKLQIICKKHGLFEQIPYSHLSGSGCPTCGKSRIAITRRSKTTLSDFIKKAKEKHNEFYSYPDQEYNGSNSKIRIICPIHGEFLQGVSNHLHGFGCTKCGVDKSRSDKRDNMESFIKKSKLIHGDFYIYPDQVFNGCKEKITIKCPDHGDFYQIPNNHLCGSGCPKCKDGARSLGEKEICHHVKDHDFITNHRIDVVGLESKIAKKSGKTAKNIELDIYFNKNKLAIEFNGLYWHREDAAGKDYHAGKMQACNELGIDLIQVFEDEWYYKKDIVKSIISTRLGVYESRYYARKTTLVEVDSLAAGLFYDKNHIQGKIQCRKHYGLSIDGEIIAMASFGNRSHLFKNNNDIELIRFCTKLNTQVVGGLSKLLSTYKGQTIKTYCDLRLFNGSGYKSVGFKELHISTPSYYYVKGMRRFSRFNFQKHKLEKVLDNFDASKSEVENMANNGYYRVFDCGNLVMILN
jgi:hypothetical protein